MWRFIINECELHYQLSILLDLQNDYISYREYLDYEGLLYQTPEEELKLQQYKNKVDNQINDIIKYALDGDKNV